MSSAQTKLRGRQTKLNFEYSVCIVLLCAFLALLGFVVAMFIASADADDISLDERAGITSSSHVPQTASAAASSSSAASASAVSASSASAKSAKAASAAAGATATASAGSSSAVAAVKSGEREGNSEIRAKAVEGLGEKHVVTYVWEGLPNYFVDGLYDAAGSRQFPFLPSDSVVRAGLTYPVDFSYTAGFTLYTMENKQKTGKYVFSGWSLLGNITMPDEDLVITGKWTFEKIDPEDDSSKKDDKGDGPDDSKKDDKDDTPTKEDKLHNVTYSWEGLLVSSQGNYEDEEGNVVQISLPASASVAEGEEFEVDSKWQAGMKFYYRDSSTGTRQSIYEFEGWELSGTQTMGTDDVQIKGKWKRTNVKVRLKFAWKDDLGPEVGCVLHKDDGSEFTLKYPLEEQDVTPGAPLQFEQTYEIDTCYTELNEDGSVKCYWVFHEWTSKDATGMDILDNEPGSDVYSFNVGDTDVTIYGTWTRHSEKPQF